MNYNDYNAVREVIALEDYEFKRPHVTELMKHIVPMLKEEIKEKDINRLYLLTDLLEHEMMNSLVELHTWGMNTVIDQNVHKSILELAEYIKYHATRLIRRSALLEILGDGDDPLHYMFTEGQHGIQ